MWIVAGVLFLLWVLLNNKTSRSDGTLVVRPPYRRMLGCVAKTRNESVVYFDSQVNAEPLLRYMEATRQV